MTSTAAFSIVPPQEQLVDRNGFITRSWWRFFSSLFAAAGGGTTPPAQDVSDLAFLNAVQSSDADAAAARTAPLLYLPPADAGRIAALEAQVEYLTRLVVEQGVPRAQQPLPAWDAVQIYSLGRH